MSQQQQTNFRDKILGARLLDVEQILLETIEQIMLAPLKIAELGDATKANAVMEGLVLNLDAFFSRVVLSEEGRDTAEYQRQRNSLIEQWGVSAEMRKAPTIETVRDLFKVTVEEMARERLFRTRRYVYFGFHWKQGKQVKLDELEKLEADEEAEERGDTNGQD